ncbi:hypothetical protein PGQ11_003448 [Apiospora arundinis]|uniref:Uncharacterized protein n=1 Tax=Apiospora arundinis TaxID=335852 RepID=A0ABR2J573_9PEZI
MRNTASDLMGHQLVRQNCHIHQDVLAQRTEAELAAKDLGYWNVSGMLLETKNMGIKLLSVSASAAGPHVNPGPENRSIAVAKLPRSASLHLPPCDTHRQLMASSSTSRRRLQPRRQTTPGHKTTSQPPWQPCRRCGKSYVQLPTELCNECDKKLYCTAPPLKIRLDDKRPLLQAEPLVFPVAPPPPPQKPNGTSTKVEKQGRRGSKTLPSIDSVVGAPVVVRQSSSKTSTTSGSQRSSSSAARESKTNVADGRGAGESPVSQSPPSQRPSIRRKPVPTPVKEDVGPVYELPAEPALASVERETRGRRTERDNRPLQVLQQAQQQQKRLAEVAASAPPPPPMPPSPPPRTYLIAQPTQDPQASFAQRVVRDAGGPLTVERQRVLAQELDQARAELECSRRAVRNLNEEMARMSLRKFRADDLRRVREENRRLQNQISSSSSSTKTRMTTTKTTTARVKVEVAEQGQRRQRPKVNHSHHDCPQYYSVPELRTLLQKGEADPDSLARVYGELCERCREAVQDFIES